MERFKSHHPVDKKVTSDAGKKLCKKFIGLQKHKLLAECFMDDVVRFTILLR